MTKRNLIFLLCFLSTQAFSQWKSHYPETAEDKKQIEKEKKQKNQEVFDKNFFLALTAKSAEDYDLALKNFKKCIELNEKISAPFYESALININLGNTELATEQIKKALDLDPKNKWYVLAYAELLFSQQEFKNAATQYKKLINIEPDNKELYFILADIYIYDNSFQKAINIYNKLEEENGVEKNISIQKHNLYMQMQNKKEAIKELQKALKTYSKDIQLLELLAEAYLLDNEKEKAFEIFKKIAIISPENGRIHLTLADYYRENKEEEKSFLELKKAFESTSLDIDTKVRIIISYFQLIPINEKMKDQAYQLAEILILIHKGNPKAHAVYGDVLYTDNRFEKAKEQYLIVLLKDKSKMEVWSQVLFIQAEQSDFAEMLKTSEEALSYFPTNPLFYYFSGISNRWAENYKEAIQSLETGLDFIIDNENLLQEFYSSLGDLYNSIKKYKDSDSFYEKALRINPENIIVLNNYAYYLSLRKEKINQAKEMSLKCNLLEENNGTYQDTYAWILYQNKEYIKAKEWILKALNNGGSKSAIIVEHYGDILYQTGEPEEAIIQWNKAKKIGKGSPFLEKKIKDKRLYE